VIVPDPGLLLFKMAIAATVVVTCSLIAERSGPLVAALIATLPISLGPVLVFLALEHGPAFLSSSALGTLNANAAHASFLLVYVLMAQRFSTLPSLLVTLLVWAVVLLAIRGLSLTILPLTVLTVVVLACVHRILRPYLAARPKVAPRPAWYALPLRAAGVALLAGGVTTASSRVGPAWSGVFAGMPVVLSSLVLILQPRIGGPAAAAVMANGALGLLGVGLGLAVVHVLAVPLGSWAALALGLAVPVTWNMTLFWLSRRPSP
jgi:hypothetical protein